MTGATAFAIAAMTLFGLGDFIFKCSARAGVQAPQFLMVQAWVFAALMLAYALATGTLEPTPLALWGSAGGLFIYVGFYNFARSLALGSVSINAPIFRLNFLITVALAIWLLGEPLTGDKIAALTLALIAIGLLFEGVSADGDISSGLSARSLAHVGIAALSFGIGNFLHKIGASEGVPPATMGMAQAAVYVPLATLVGLRATGSLAAPRVTWKFASAASAVLVAAFLALLGSLARGEASAVVPITQMSFIVSAALGVAVLGESFSLRMLAGICAALASLAVLAAG